MVVNNICEAVAIFVKRSLELVLEVRQIFRSLKTLINQCLLSDELINFDLYEMSSTTKLR